MAELIDDAGTHHTPVSSPRILSLVPSLTETLIDLGLKDHLVGRTTFCIHPEKDVKVIPSVGGTKRINMDKVRKIKPSHAIVNVDENPKQMADDLEKLGISVTVTHPIQPADNIKLFRLLGGLFNVRDMAEKYIAEFNDIFHRPCPRQPQNRVLYLIWKDPWMTINNETYIAHTLAWAGLRHYDFKDAPRYPEIELTEQVLSAVDHVLFSSEPYAFKQTDLDHFAKMFPEHGHKARLINGEYTSWYGTRSVAGLRYLADFAKGVRTCAQR